MGIPVAPSPVKMDIHLKIWRTYVFRVNKKYFFVSFFLGKSQLRKKYILSPYIEYKTRVKRNKIKEIAVQLLILFIYYVVEKTRRKNRLFAFTYELQNKIENSLLG